VKRLPVILGLLLCLCWCATAAEVIPPKPEQYFNDYAHVVSPGTAQRLNHELEDFEKQMSSQIVVVVYPKMQSDSSIEDYTFRVAQAWRVGQKEKDNGAVLFVFTQDHRMFIQVGYGLEGALPDATCKRIVDEEIAPHFKRGDFDGGLSAGVDAMLAAAKGEYKGTGQTVAQGKARKNSFLADNWVILLIIAIILLGNLTLRRRPRRSSGWMMSGGGWGGWYGGGGGWSGGGGGGSSGGGGSFSSGGGNFGGGGAGGSW